MEITDSFYAIRIADLSQAIDNEDLLKFRLRQDKDLLAQGLMIVDSERVIRRAVGKGVNFISVLVSTTALAQVQDLLQEFDSSCSIFYAEEKTIAEFLGGRVHQTMMGLAIRPLLSPSLDFSGSAVLLNGIEDPQNLGSIIRNCHAFGIETILLDQHCCHPFSRRSIRVSMGSVFWMKYYLLESVLSGVQNLKAKGYRIVAADLDQTAVAIRGYNFVNRSILTIGSEFKGVSQEVKLLADALIKIPISRSIDSLNAGSASAILLEHFSAQVGAPIS